MTTNKKEFSFLRALFWPIHVFELKNFLPMLLLAFFIGFNYSILRNLKDALIVTAKGSGAEVLPFLKVWGMIPGAILITMFYGFLSSKFRQEIVFYLMVGFFITFFLIFAFWIYPNNEALNLHKTADWLAARLPKGLFGLLALVRFWSFTLFYVISELWSSTILSMLFWGFANRITTFSQAPRFYAMLHLSLSLSSVVAGQVTVWASQYRGEKLFFPFATSSWHGVIIGLTLLMAMAGIVIVFVYRHIYSMNFFSGPQDKAKAFQEASNSKSKSFFTKRADESKIKMKIKDIIKAMFRSKYLLCLSGIVLSYNLVIHLVEVLWKDQARTLYPDPVSFNMYMGHVSSITGALSGLCCCLITGQTIRKWGWRFGALVTPIVCLFTGVCFFFTLLFCKNMNFASGVLSGVIASPLALVVFFGGVQNILTRVAKYSFFDATKEMAFVPLSEKAKMQGKALIDGIFSRCGKSAAALFLQVFFLIFSSLASMVPLIAVIFFVAVGIWLLAILALGKRFDVFLETSGTTGENLHDEGIDSLNVGEPKDKSTDSSSVTFTV
ncbi:ADP,ATP carrier protein 2 [Candidatus Clavichlamydia salmonicola]|uniref:Npt1/Npt2 family nucleotide transporter n=1 Tax=Candidatus Clavichlamydia salmonicola TaxID=469812 RepID=UPI001891D253|nr:Npt1/Npt2 family nucleotide transporter [Candidatus Clavichlamydia salmonicola]MBF5050982.1 ADP,ATP carrier protein 2 [Candidatus Clavichlamydia salmonicola]